MISVPFELEYVEFGILFSGIPLPEKSQKEYGQSCRMFNKMNFSHYVSEI